MRAVVVFVVGCTAEACTGQGGERKAREAHVATAQRARGNRLAACCMQGRSDVLYARALVPAGHKCVCVAEGLPTWLCELMVKRGDIHEAIAYIKDIESEINKELETLIE